MAVEYVGPATCEQLFRIGEDRPVSGIMEISVDEVTE